jgi:peptidoglycan/xylan/chitin deacetylase (PgdA/CDA1 family)
MAPPRKRLTELTSRIGQSVRFHTSRLVCERADLKPFPCRLQGGIVSFTFDDFPASAHRQGGKILEAHGARGTYYASYGAMAGPGDGGTPAAAAGQIEGVLEAGHEIGCHTYSHLDCASSGAAASLEDIDRNARALAPILEPYLGNAALAHFAYPFGRVNRTVKRPLGRRFQTCRGIFPGINQSPVDLALLRANKLYGGARNFARARRLVGDVARRGGWLIFFTHDVGEDPTPYGCTRRELEEIVELAARSDCRLATIGQAMAQLGYGGQRCST